jgi:phosphohistidine phosphatase SixA
MRVYLVRHAEAAPGEPDELRALSAAGRETARALGDRLAAEARVDAVLCSPLLRARETAEAIAQAAGVPAVSTELLAPGAAVDDLLEAVAGRGETVVCVGHQPDCGQIAAALGKVPAPQFPPGGLARLDLPV